MSFHLRADTPQAAQEKSQDHRQGSSGEGWNSEQDAEHESVETPMPGPHPRSCAKPPQGATMHSSEGMKLVTLTQGFQTLPMVAPLSPKTRAAAIEEWLSQVESDPFAGDFEAMAQYHQDCWDRTVMEGLRVMRESPLEAYVATLNGPTLMFLKKIPEQFPQIPCSLRVGTLKIPLLNSGHYQAWILATPSFDANEPNFHRLRHPKPQTFSFSYLHREALLKIAFAHPLPDIDRDLRSDDPHRVLPCEFRWDRRYALGDGPAAVRVRNAVLRADWETAFRTRTQAGRVFEGEVAENGEEEVNFLVEMRELGW